MAKKKPIYGPTLKAELKPRYLSIPVDGKGKALPEGETVKVGIGGEVTIRKGQEADKAKRKRKEKKTIPEATSEQYKYCLEELKLVKLVEPFEQAEESDD